MSLSDWFESILLAIGCTGYVLAYLANKRLDTLEKKQEELDK